VRRANAKLMETPELDPLGCGARDSLEVVDSPSVVRGTPDHGSFALHEQVMRTLVVRVRYPTPSRQFLHIVAVCDRA
jgi:hypothetical protein